MNSKPNPLTAAPIGDPADVGMAETAVPGAASLSAEQEAALREALEDLAGLDEYAAEKSLPPPASAAKQAAQAFLRQAVREAPRRYAVCPWSAGAVVVYTRGAEGFGADIFFGAGGDASCYVSRPEEQGDEEHHYPQAGQVANERIFAALRNLAG